MSHIRLPPGSVTSEKCFQEFPQHSVGGSTTTIESYWFNLPIQNCPALRSPLRHNISSDPAAAAAKSLQSCLTLCDPIDSSPPGSLVPGILQARTLEWVAISFSNAWKWKVKVKSFSRVRLSDPMDYSSPGSSVHGVFQARTLQWGAIAFSASDPETPN